MKASGKLDFGLAIKITRKTVEGIRHNWTFELDIPEKPTLSEFKCAWKNDCQKFETFLLQELKDEVLTFKNGHPYDQPIAARELLGFLKYLNQFSEQEVETVHAEV